MNHRIRELERQATETVRCGLNGTSTAESFNRKKFAELLVRECLESVKEDMYSGFGYHSEFSTGADWALATAINNIKEKFGVEL